MVLHGGLCILQQYVQPQGDNVMASNPQRATRSHCQQLLGLYAQIITSPSGAGPLVAVAEAMHSGIDSTNLRPAWSRALARTSLS